MEEIINLGYLRIVDKLRTAKINYLFVDVKPIKT